MLEYLIVILVSFGASVIGAICGIGGGVIIKPVLDALGVIPVNTISFLSGCTVFSMAVISVGKQIYSGKKQNFDRKKGSWLAAGAVAGGIAGKSLYQMILRRLPDTQRVGAVQAAVLLAVTAGTLIYTLKKRPDYYETCNEQDCLCGNWNDAGYYVSISGNRRRSCQSGCAVLFFLHGNKTSGYTLALYYCVFTTCKYCEYGSERTDTIIPTRPASFNGALRCSGRNDRFRYQ